MEAAAAGRTPLVHQHGRSAYRVQKRVEVGSSRQPKPSSSRYTTRRRRIQGRAGTKNSIPDSISEAYAGLVFTATPHLQTTPRIFNINLRSQVFASLMLFIQPGWRRQTNYAGLRGGNAAHQVSTSFTRTDSLQETKQVYSARECLTQSPNTELHNLENDCLVLPRYSFSFVPTKTWPPRDVGCTVYNTIS